MKPIEIELRTILRKFWDNDEDVPDSAHYRTTELDWFSSGIKDNIVSYIAIKMFGLAEAQKLLNEPSLDEIQAVSSGHKLAEKHLSFHQIQDDPPETMITGYRRGRDIYTTGADPPEPTPQIQADCIVKGNPAPQNKVSGNWQRYDSFEVWVDPLPYKIAGYFYNTPVKILGEVVEEGYFCVGCGQRIVKKIGQIHMCRDKRGISYQETWT